MDLPVSQQFTGAGAKERRALSGNVIRRLCFAMEFLGLIFISLLI